jgi:hypothetical protein
MCEDGVDPRAVRRGVGGGGGARRAPTKRGRQRLGPVGSSELEELAKVLMGLK